MDNKKESTNPIQRLIFDIWGEIVSYLDYEDMINLMFVSKYFQYILEKIWLSENIVLPLIRNNIHRHFQCHIPFESFPIDKENKHQAVNYKNIYQGFAIFKSQDVKLYEWCSSNLEKENLPEAEFIRMILFLYGYPKISSKLIIQNFLIAEKFCQLFPHLLTKLILSNFLVFFGTECIKNPELLKEINTNEETLLFRAGTQLSSTIKKCRFEKKNASFSKSYSNLIKGIFVAILDDCGFPKEVSGIDDLKTNDFVQYFTFLRSYKMLTSIKRYSLQSQAFKLEAKKYRDFKLRDNAWVFDIYKADTFNILNKLENAREIDFIEIGNCSAINLLMEDEATSFDSKYRNITLLLKLLDMPLPTGKMEDTFSSIMLQSYQGLFSHFPLSNALKIYVTYWKHPIFLKCLKNHNINKMFLKTSSHILNEIANYLRQNEGYKTSLIPDLITLFQLAHDARSLIALKRFLQVNPKIENPNQIDNIMRTLNLPKGISASIELNKYIPVWNNQSSEKKSEKLSFLFVNKVKIKCRKRKRKNNTSEAESLKRLKESDTTDKNYKMDGK